MATYSGTSNTAQARAEEAAVAKQQGQPAPVYSNTPQPVSANDQRLQALTDGGWSGSSNAQGQPVGDLAIFQAKKNPQAIVSSQAAKNDVNKIQSDFESMLSSISNKQQYNQTGLNVANSVVDAMKSKGIADTSAQARTQLANQAGISDYNPANAESNKKLAEAIMNSRAVGSAMSELKPNTPEYDAAMNKVSGTIVSATKAGEVPPPPPAAEPLTSIGTKVSQDPAMAAYDKVTAQIDNNNSAISSSLDQLKTGGIPLTADQVATVDQTQRAFDNAIAQQKSANQSQENTARMSAFRGGSEYTPDVSSSIIKSVVESNTLKIKEYDMEAMAAISKLKQGFKEANYKNIKESYELLQTSLKDKQSNLLSLMKLSHEYEKESLNHSLDTLKYNETMRHNKADEANATYKAENKAAGFTVSGPNANVINTILGSGKFTEAQSKMIANSINNGEDASVVIKNQAKGLMSGTNQTTVEKLDVARSALSALKNSLNTYYAAGGSTNIVNGTFEQMYNKLGVVNDPKLVSVAAQIRSNLMTYRNQISGTAYSEQEGKQIESVFPGISKNKELNDAIFDGVSKNMDAALDGYYEGVLGKNIYSNLKANEQTQADEKMSKTKFDLQAVMGGVKAETDAAVKAGKMTAQEASDKVYNAVKKARLHNESLTNVGSDTNTATKGGKVVAGYDIGSYATDPTHERKVASIYGQMPTISNANDATAYIAKVAKNSPVTGQAVMAASQRFNVDPKLIMAIMVQDSTLGTAGKAIRTKNPGNVGNTDSGATKGFNTWEDGVMAVAKNLALRKV